MYRKIDFYRTVSGDCPVEDLLDGLEPSHAQKVIWVLKLIEDLDRVPSKYLKKLQGADGLWECRVLVGSTHYRFICFPIKHSLILVNAFVKKQKNIPSER